MEVAGWTCRPLVWWRAATDEIDEMRQEVVLSRTDVVDRSGDTSRKTENFDATAIYLQCWLAHIYSPHIDDFLLLNDFDVNFFPRHTVTYLPYSFNLGKK